MQLDHHCIPLEKIIFRELRPDPKHSDKDFKPAYRWLEEQVGFYPLFLGVGADIKDLAMTGYDKQWSRIEE